MYIGNRKIVVGGVLLATITLVHANNVRSKVERDLFSFSALDELLAQDPPPTNPPTRPPVDDGEDNPRPPPPTKVPTTPPTATQAPSGKPTGSAAPTISNAPTSTPSTKPTSQPSGAPSHTPSRLPSSSPSKAPTSMPSATPSAMPSKTPSSMPSSLPSVSPSTHPSVSLNPTIEGPTTSPSRTPTITPSSAPSPAPSSTPSVVPSAIPSTVPSSEPSSKPTNSPSKTPSSSPSQNPSSSPSNKPTVSPSSKPTMHPSIIPTTSQNPSSAPTPPPTRFPTRTPSRTPTFSPTSCPNPENCLRFQTQGDTGFFVIQKCAASCDFDIQCERGLVCYQRSLGQKSVPGCIGDADQIGTGNHNFCVQPPSNQLVLLGLNRSPSDVYPLRQCAGDCDNDSDCASGLFCFERNGFENIPGCIGSGQQAFDYCFSPGSGFERLAFFGNLDYDYYELGQCEGDCDFDSDCEIGLVCYEREGGDNGSVPRCVGNANLIGFGNDDFCIPRPSSNTLISVFENEVGGDTAGGGIFPIPKCAGDCDSDADCQPGLTCFQRAGFNAVPGCSGFGEEDFDYCI